MSGLLIIGASYAGVQAAISAREQGYTAAIRIVADELHLPYLRPPLSKAYLSGSVEDHSLFLRGEPFFAALQIELVLGKRAVQIDRATQSVALDDGSLLQYETLLLATGSRARRLAVPGADSAEIVYLRTLDDALALKPRLAAAKAVVIIGGGFIGLEVAATAAKAGKTVTLLEAAPRLLERAVAPGISQFLLALHQRHGVDVRLNQTVHAISAAADGSHVVTSASGDVASGDLIVAGVGGIANDEIARDAGIACSNGIDVDDCGRTDAPDIYAAGDCANHHSRHARRRVRLESVQNATDQGKAVGHAVAGKPEAYDSVPRFWSDQYDVKLQIVGLSEPQDIPIIRGDVDQGRFSVFYFRSSVLCAVDSINKPGDQMIARRLIASAISPTLEQAADPAFNLKTLDVST